jgi:hypothetical protein
MPDPKLIEQLSDAEFLADFDRFLAEFDARRVETVQDFAEAVEPVVIEAKSEELT